MPRFLPVGKDAEGAAKFLLAALPALGALLTALAITGDLVGRMARDHPWAAFGAFGCAALAVFLGAVAAFGFRAGSAAERRALYLGLVALGAGLVCTVYAGVRTWGDRPQPSVTLTPRRGSVLISVRGTGLRSSDHLVVEVEQLLRAPGEDGRLTWRPGQPLYGASLGPDGAGSASQTVDVPLPAGDFDDIGARVWVGREPKDCYADRNTTGCVRVHVPRPAERPQLAVDWETFVRAPRVLIRLKARNLPQRPSRSMALRVYGLAPPSRRACSRSGRSRPTSTAASTGACRSSSVTRFPTSASSRARRRVRPPVRRRSTTAPCGRSWRCRRLSSETARRPTRRPAGTGPRADRR
jgi:hypothetical protein